MSETGKVKVTSSGNVYDFTYFTDRDTTYKNFQAVNVTAGLLWDIWRKDEKLVTFGAVFDSPYTADLDQVRDFMEVIDVEGIIAVNKLHDRHHFEVDYPMSFGAGFGYHYSDALSFSMNITRTDWSVYMQEDENGVETCPIQGAPEETDVDDTYAVRCGTEYLIMGKKVIVPVRGGLFYDPLPDLGDPTDVYGVSVGSGITFNRFSLDGAYQFRWAPSAGSDKIGTQRPDFDFYEHLFLASVIVYL